MQIGLYNYVMATRLPSRAGTWTIRPLGPDDRQGLRRLFAALSPETIYRRFMSPIARLEEGSLDRLLDLDHQEREALALVSEGEIVGVARYDRNGHRETAEVAVVVADAWQRQGAGSLLMKRLAMLARQRGITAFTGVGLGENRAVVALARSLSPGMKARWSSGQIELQIPLAQPSP
jgi:GNAT superfamily N-acetyltransferase